MFPVQFEGVNKILTAPKGQEDRVQPLPVFTDGIQVISCWEFTDEEMELFLKTKRIFINCECGDKFYPIYPSPQNIVPPCLSAFKMLTYKFKGKIADAFIEVYNSIDRPAPNVVSYNSGMYYLTDSYLHRETGVVNGCKFYLRMPRPEELHQRKQNLLVGAGDLQLQSNIPNDLYQSFLDNIDEIVANRPCLIEIVDDQNELMHC